MWPAGPYKRRDPLGRDLLLLVVVTWTRSGARGAQQPSREAARGHGVAAAWGATPKPATQGVEESGFAFECVLAWEGQGGQDGRKPAAHNTWFVNRVATKKRTPFPHLHTPPGEVGGVRFPSLHGGSRGEGMRQTWNGAERVAAAGGVHRQVT